MSREPIACPNYEVVFSGAEVLLTFDAGDVAFLSPFVLEEPGQRLGGAPVALSVSIAPASQPSGSAADTVVANFGEHGDVAFPALPAEAEKAARAAGKIWIVALDGVGVISEAALPLA